MQYRQHESDASDDEEDRKDKAGVLCNDDGDDKTDVSYNFVEALLDGAGLDVESLAEQMGNLTMTDEQVRELLAESQIIEKGISELHNVATPKEFHEFLDGIEDLRV